MLVRVAGLADADTVAGVLAAAYEDYPWAMWAFPGPRHQRVERLRGLHRLFAGLLGGAAGSTWLAEEDGQVLSVASWQRPDSSRPSTEMLRRMEQELPELLGDRAAALEEVETLTAPDRPPGDSWTLASVGTLRAHRGQGLAAATIRAGLDAVDAAGLPASLETSAEGNVRLYARLGFTISAEYDPPAGAPHLWVMTRPASLRHPCPR